jgi:hypothetical protein
MGSAADVLTSKTKDEFTSTETSSSSADILQASARLRTTKRKTNDMSAAKTEPSEKEKVSTKKTLTSPTKLVMPTLSSAFSLSSAAAKNFSAKDIPVDNSAFLPATQSAQISTTTKVSFNPKDFEF